MQKTEIAREARLSALIEIVRPATTLKAAPYTLLGAYLGGSLAHVLTGRVWLAALVVCLIVAFGFVINDYRDVAVDALSKSQRPIPSGRIAQRDAGILAVVLAVSALAVAATLGLFLAIFALCAIALSGLYSYQLKGKLLLGNATVAVLDASIVVYGSYASTGPTRAVWVISVLTFLYILAFEVLHNVADRTGDALAGLRTTGTRLGLRNGLRLFRVTATLFIGVALLCWLVGFAPDRFLYTVVPCSILPTIGIIVLLNERADEYALCLSIRLMKLVWILSLLPVLLIK